LPLPSGFHGARISARFLLVRKHNDQNNPDLPFRYGYNYTESV
jgi:hypothetical protein